MQSRFIFIIIGITLISILVGFYFFYNAVFKDDTSEQKNIELIEKRINEKSAPLSSSSSTGDKSQKSTIIIHPMPNESKLKNSKNQQVVDQTLKVKKYLDETTKPNLSGVAFNEEVELEITLIDLEQNKLLSNIEIGVQYKLNQEQNQNEKYKSDSKGTIRIFLSKPGLFSFQIFTSEFGLHNANMILHRNHNEYQAPLLKGGNFEVRAFDNEGKIVEGLELGILNGRLNIPKQSFVFNKNSGEYLFSRMPTGAQLISFKAPGYWQSPEFLVRIEANQTTTLEVLMRPARKIYFDFENIPKPEHIIVIKGNSLIKDNKDFNPNDTKVISKNQNFLFEFILDDPQCNAVIVSVDSYAPQVVPFRNETDTYILKLKATSSGELQIVNQDRKPVEGALVNYYLRSNDGGKSTPEIL